MNLETTIAGDTLDFTVEVPDYPASDGWTLKYRLTPRFTSPVQAPIPLEATANADGERYDIEAGPGTTAAWEAGAYTWARWVEKAGARQTLDESGQLEVKADPALTAQGYDARSHARKMLDAINAAMEAFSIGVKQYTIGSRSMTKQDIPELLTLRDRYRAEVANEEAAAKVAAGLPNPRNVGIRFNRV
jgi:hypothetical protein